MPFWGRGANRAKLEHKLCMAKETPEPVFDLSECNIHEVPSGVFSMCRVFRKEVLLLQNNLLQSLEGGGSLAELSLLRVLNLGNNKFYSLPKNISCLHSLEVLNLENNYLKAIPETITELTKLHSLNIKGNKFRTFPMVVCTLSGLRYLNISSNDKLKNLPKELSNLMCLETLELDVYNVIYPPSDVTSNGAECIIRFLCQESKKDYVPGRVLDVAKSDVVDDRRESLGAWEENHLIATFEQYQRAKEQKQKEMLQMEEVLKENDLLQAQLATDAFTKRQKLLADVTQEQEKLDKEMLDLQKKKKVERDRLMEYLSNLEDHSEELINQLMELNEKNRNMDNMLERLEQDRVEIEEMFSVNQEELEEMRKKDILDSMKNMLEAEEKQRQYEAERLEITRKLQDNAFEEESKFQDALFGRELDQQALLNKLLEEEQYQKEAFEALQLQRDKRHQEILYQIKLIETELSKLTMAEVKKQDLKVNFEVNILAERRAALAILLADLLQAKEKREEVLKTRLLEMEEKRLDEIKDFWLLQYQKLMDRKPPEILDAEEQMDPMVRELLIDIGAMNYIPLFAIKCVTFKELLAMSFIDLKRLGLLDNIVCEAVLSKCSEYVASEKLETEAREPAPVPSAPPQEEEEMSNVHPTAPLLSPETEIKLFCQTECVICLDRQSTSVFIPCGHVCCCWGCSGVLTACPMCRNAIETKLLLSAA